MEKQLLGHYWVAEYPDGGQVVIYFYEINAREGGSLQTKRLAIWTELVRGRVTYKTEPTPFAITPSTNIKEAMLTFEGINQGNITVLPDYFVLDLLTNTFTFRVLSDPEVRQLYKPLLP